jgi:hypothetical protein
MRLCFTLCGMRNLAALCGRSMACKRCFTVHGDCSSCPAEPPSIGHAHSVSAALCGRSMACKRCFTVHGDCSSCPAEPPSIGHAHSVSAAYRR